MLTEGDRAELAPHLAKIHAAHAALVQAEQTAAETHQYVIDFQRGSTFWDRTVNRDGPIGLAYREARAARRDAMVTVARRREEARALEVRLDDQIELMMPRLDPDYAAAGLVITRCGLAVPATTAMRNPIHNLVRNVRTATKPGRDNTSVRTAAEGARLRYPDHLALARQASRAVKRAVDPVRAAVAKAGVRSPDLVWDDGALARLPRTAEGINALRILIRELPKLQRLPQRLDRIRADLTKLQKRTGLAQKAARIRARKKLIEDSARPGEGQ